MIPIRALSSILVMIEIFGCMFIFTGSVDLSKEYEVNTGGKSNIELEITDVSPMIPAAASPAPETASRSIPPAVIPVPINPIPASEKRILPLLEEKTPLKSSPTPKSPSAKVFRPVNWGHREEAKMCLTFDDGYSRTSILNALDVLKEQDVHCTFFIVGAVLQENKDLWLRAVAEGHQICNHTYSHGFLTGFSDEKIKREIEKWEETAAAFLGTEYVNTMKKEFPYLRLPGGAGSSNSRVLGIVHDMKYIPVGWSTDTVYSVLRHYKSKKGQEERISTEICNHVVNNSKNGAIILLHFNKYDTAKLSEIISGIKKKSLDLMLISEVI